jgi:hypothetical protein
VELIMQMITIGTVSVPRRRAEGYAAKFRAETINAEPVRSLPPTDANLAMILDRCGRPARPEEYPAVRQALAEWPEG